MTIEKPKSAPRRLSWRTLLKLALLAVCIAVLIPALQIIIPAVQYRDDLIALLNYSDDCKAPCFMGITPGVTTKDEAVKILENHEWVSQFGRAYPSEDREQLHWNWSGKAPLILSSTTRYSNAIISTSTNTVTMLSVSTHTTLATGFFTLGIPAGNVNDRLPDYFSYLYKAQRMLLIVDCSETLYDLLQSELVIYFGYPAVNMEPFVLETLTCPQYGQ